MSLLRDVIKEMAAGGTTGAHAIGGHGGHETTADLAPAHKSNFYDGGVVNPKKAKKKQKKKYNKMMSYNRQNEQKMTFSNMLRRQIPQMNEASYQSNLDPNKKIVVRGVKGISSKKFTKKFKNEKEFDKWLDANEDDVNITQVVNEADETKFDPASVLSKMDAAEKQAKIGQDTVTFGMKNDEGQIIQVSVRAEQADEFEQALQSMLSGEDDDQLDNENSSSSMEIAEVLYKLRGKFEIVDVVWPTIQGDEQQEQEVETDQDQEPGDQEGDDEDLELAADDGDDEDSDKNGDDEEDDEEDEEDESDDDSNEDEEGDMEAGENGVESHLQSVIDLLRQQAEAQKADAEAREAEAEREEAKYAAQAAASKVKQEEDILDMEAYYDKKDKADKEAKNLAKLAKYKHEKASDAQASLSSGGYNNQATEQQELAQHYRTNIGGVDDTDDDDELDKEELANMIYSHLRTSQ